MTVAHALNNSPVHNVVLRKLSSDPVEIPSYLVKGLLPEKGVALLAGQYASGKTFIGLDLVLSLGHSKPFLGLRVRGGGALWLAGEGVGELPQRIAAARAAKFAETLNEPLPFFFAEPPAGVPPAAMFVYVENAIIAAKAECEHFGEPLRIVVIDTLAAVFAVKDENDNAEAALLMRWLAEIGNRQNVLIVPVAHQGKAAESGVRGASAFGAGADAILSVLAVADQLTGKVSKRSLALSKSRRGGTGPLGAFNLPFQQLAVDEDGEPFGSCFVQFHSNDNVEEPEPKRNLASPEFLEAMRIAIRSHGAEQQVDDSGEPVKAVAVAEVRKVFHRLYMMHNPDNLSGAKDKAWQRAYKTAVAQRVVGSLFLRPKHEVIWFI